MTDQTISRQVRRANERRAAKDARMASIKQPSPTPTSTKWLGRTKGMPFSRMILRDVAPGSRGRPALLLLDHPTRKTGAKVRRATPALLDVFFPSIPDNFRASMLGH